MESDGLKEGFSAQEKLEKSGASRDKEILDGNAWKKYSESGLWKDKFEGVIFSKINFSEDDLSESFFENCFFKKCSFASADVSGSKFVACSFGLFEPSDVVRTLLGKLSNGPVHIFAFGEEAENAFALEQSRRTRVIAMQNISKVFFSEEKSGG